jgi:hypothetical protein
MPRSVAKLPNQSRGMIFRATATHRSNASGWGESPCKLTVTSAKLRRRGRHHLKPLPRLSRFPNARGRVGHLFGRTRRRRTAQHRARRSPAIPKARITLIAQCAAAFSPKRHGNTDAHFVTWRAPPKTRHTLAISASKGVTKMSQLTVITFVTLDGVMQAPSAPDEDRSGNTRVGTDAQDRPRCWRGLDRSRVQPG